MPYASVSDLPESIRNALPAHGQSIFLSAFNSAYKEYNGDEQRTNAVAWAAVKQSYHKNDKGDWVRNSETNNLFSFDNLAEFTAPYEITLQTLNTRHPHPDYPDGLFYSADNFSGTEKDWDRDLVVFAPPGKEVKHVDHDAFARDPAGEANRLGYRIAGRLNNTQTGPGENPRFISQIVFTDAEAKKFADKRQLGLSSAFNSAILDGSLSGKVVPNHVLLFMKCAGKPDGFCGIPNDRGAAFNNLSEETMADDEVKGMFGKILEHVTPKENPLQKTVDNLNEEVTKRDVQIDALKKENETLKAAKSSLDNLMAEQAKAKDNARWAEVKNLHQPGLFHKEKEAVERAAFEADNAGWLMAHVGNLQTVKAKPALGAEAIGNLGEDEGKPFDVGAARGKLDPKTGTFTGGM